MVEKAPLAKCDECPLVDRPFVPGKGPDKSEIAIVGEAPGRDEAKKGIPFIGKSGQLLDKVLKYHGIEKEKVYFTNTVLCYPPYNELEKKQEAPTAKAIKACRDRLIAELKEREPKTVLALGAVAGKNLLKTTEGITHLRIGGPRRSDELDADVIPTFHTAAALRNPDYFPSIVRDVKKIKEPIGVGWEHTIWYEAKPNEVEASLEYQLTHNNGLLSLDIECDPSYPRQHPEFICIGISHMPGKAVVYPREMLPRIAPMLEKAFKDKKQGWIMQNGKFDVQRLWSLAPSAHHTEDTMLAHYATDERIGTHSLEQLATEILGAPNYKREFREAMGEDEGAHIWTVESYQQHRDIVHRYNATDADVTLRLHDPLLEEMRRDDVEKVYRNLLIPGSNALCKVEYEGIAVNEEKLDGLEEELSKAAEMLESGTEKWVKNPRSWQQIKSAMLELGYEVPNTQKATLEPYRDKEEFVDKLLEYKATHKLLSTYVRGLRKHIFNGRVHCNFTLSVTVTGRLSARRPNLQNIPIDKPVREVFMADTPDHRLLETDYSQLELRLLAALSRDPWMMEQFEKGISIHKAMAEALFGQSYDAKQYVEAKNTNFGIAYLETAYGLGKKLGIPTKTAERMISDWYRRAPKVREYQKSIERELAEKSYITSAFGRRRRFWLITYDNRKDVLREANNFPLQSAGTDITLTALIKLVNMGIIPRITVHDALVGHAHKDDAEELARVYAETMMESNPFDVPLEVDVKISQFWEMKKGA